MANYSNDRWTAFQYAVDDMMAKPEFKHKASPTVMKFRKNTDFLIPASEKERVLGVKQSDQDTVQISVLNQTSISTGSARAYNHTGAIGDSTKVDATFSTVSATFKYSIKQGDRVFWNLADMVAARIRSAAIAMHSTMEAAYLADLNTNKSQVVVSATPTSGAWDATNYIFGVSNADYDLFLQKIKGFMREQYYRGGMYESIFDEALFQKAENVLQQGAGNSTNLAWQGAGIDAAASTELSADSGYLGMGYIWTPGTIGVLEWVPQKNREKFGETFQNGGFYTTIPDPLGSGMTFAVHEYAEGADNDSAAGETQDIDVQVELSVDYSLIHSPMSTANADPVFKFGVLQ